MKKLLTLFILVPLLSACGPPKVDFPGIFNPKRNKSETEAEYRARHREILAQFNYAVQQRDLRYQVGEATMLDEYDDVNQNLLVEYQFEAEWLKQFPDIELDKPKKALVKIAHSDVQTLREAGEDKPLFLTLEMDGNRVKGKSIVLVEDGQMWTVAHHLDNGNGTVTDSQTGLIWLKNANCFDWKDWPQAQAVVDKLADGQCSLSDGSKPGMWRLPTKEELKELLDARYEAPAFSNAGEIGQWQEGNAFTNLKADYYWSSSAHVVSMKDVKLEYFNVGYLYESAKSNDYYVWPVRNK